MKKNILIIGHGNIGSFLFEKLRNENVFGSYINDLHFTDLKKFEHENYIENPTYNDYDLIINCTSFKNIDLIVYFMKNNISYIDFNEDTLWARNIFDLYQKIKPLSTFICGTGLSPGFISIYANHLLQKHDWAKNLKVHVGSLPLITTNSLNHDFYWSVEGLLYEYIGEGEIVKNGKLKKVKSLSGKEMIEIDGKIFESRYINGGILFGELLAEKNNLNSIEYKTLRFPDHYDFFEKIININEGKMENYQLVDLMKKIIEPLIRRYNKPKDVVYMVFKLDNYSHMNDLGNEGFAKMKSKNLMNKKEYIEKIKILGNKDNSAIQTSTVYPALGIIELILKNKIGYEFVFHHDIDYKMFLWSYYGKKFIDMWSD